MKTDVDTCLKQIADWYIKNRREITEPELESILLKHCGSETEVQKFVGFLETEPGQLRFKTLLRERKGTGGNPAPRKSDYPKVEELGHEIYGAVLSKVDAAWDFINELRIPGKPPYWEEVRDTFIEKLTEELKRLPNLDLCGEKAKMTTIGIILERYPEVFPKEVRERARR